MRCGERERLESALNDASSRQEELANHKLAKIRSGEPDHARFDSKIAYGYRAREPSATIVAGA